MPVTPSPLRYPGGKTGYASLLKKVIDANDLRGCDYAEPFAGGAGAAITLLLDNYVDSIYLNDFDPSIYCFWKAILSKTSEFIKKVKETEITIDEWKRQREIYRKQNSQRYLSLGFATFYLNRCNRAGIIGANPSSTVSPLSSSFFRCRSLKILTTLAFTIIF